MLTYGNESFMLPVIKRRNAEHMELGGPGMGHSK